MFNNFRSYVIVSVLLASGVVAHAAHVKKYFYPSIVYLHNSKVALLACGNLLLALILLIGKILQRLCLGTLRLREIERLHIRIREAVIETCMAMTVFREEFNAKFVGMFTILLFLKIFHWLSKDRVEYMEEQPNSPLLQHGRLVSLMVILFFFDVHLLVACASYTIHNGPSMLVLFAFEFAVLMISLLSNVVRYIFLSADLYFEGAWESKGMFSFYNELLSDLLQLIVYLLFFLYVQAKYTLPFHIIRDIWLTFTKFWKRYSDFKRYRRVMSTMNELFEDATEEDLASGDGICIICRDVMQPGAKKLTCGHIFHRQCLQGWLKRQLNCPTCRTGVDVNLNQNNTGQENPREGGANGFVRGLRRRYRARRRAGAEQEENNGAGEPAEGAADQPGSVERGVVSGEGARDGAAGSGSGAGASGSGPPYHDDVEVANMSKALPLDRLLRVQEQLEELRLEIRDLVIEATLAQQDELDREEAEAEVAGSEEVVTELAAEDTPLTDPNTPENVIKDDVAESSLSGSASEQPPPLQPKDLASLPEPERNAPQSGSVATETEDPETIRRRRLERLEATSSAPMSKDDVQ
ncbi:hypothetical protein NDN08_000375 [Rhodosorus marinus]|uniref:RING-type E3 ubiquitin transferase n=1 Tax=Rhodosorus marinus TaxID=101924 RepID=A0AAV8URC6_9RHOD|nr:hypothetical protein NDN08_000375 [Rhodosorus marinus]